MVRDGCGFQFGLAILPGNILLKIDGCLRCVLACVYYLGHSEDVDKYQRQTSESAET